MRPLNNKIKRNAFVPVMLPKVKDVFKRRGYLPSRESSALMGSSRNPLEIHDSVQRGFDQYAYECFCKERENERASEIERERENEAGKSKEKSDKDIPAPDDDK